MNPVYDRIGMGYAGRRRPDPRWAASVQEALGGARTVVNVGAGAGSYEPTGRVVAVEPSARMIAQRPPGATVVRAVAEYLPFPDDAFDAALAVLTVHHWSNPAQGLRELQRVAPRRQVVVTWDPKVFAEQFWFVRDYIPEAAERERRLATLAQVREVLDGVTVELPVPADCTDGFFGAYWRRPEAFLDPETRRAISGLALLEPFLVDLCAFPAGSHDDQVDATTQYLCVARDSAARLKAAMSAVFGAKQP